MTQMNQRAAIMNHAPLTFPVFLPLGFAEHSAGVRCLSLTMWEETFYCGTRLPPKYSLQSMGLNQAAVLATETWVVGKIKISCEHIVVAQRFCCRMYLLGLLSW